MHGTSERKPTLRLIAAVGGLAALIGREVSGQRSVSRAASTIARRVRPWSWRTACAAMATALACTMLSAPPAHAVSVDGAVDTAFTAANGTGTLLTSVSSIAVQSDGKILVGGPNRTNCSGIAIRGQVVRLNTDGTQDTTFTTNASAAVDFQALSIAVQSDGKIVLGGKYTPMMGSGGCDTPIGRVMRLNADGTRDTAFTANTGTGPRHFATSVAVQSDGKILVGGVFADWDGATAHAVVRLNADGTRDTAFTTANGTAASGAVNSIAVQSDGQILLGGSFTTWNSATVGKVVRLNTAGTRDTAFTTGTGAGGVAGVGVNSIAVQSDGGILLGGTFTSWNGATVGKFVRLNANGAQDTAFTTANGTGVAGSASVGVNSVAVQSDGRILLGGNFQGWSGSTAGRVLRLNSDGARDTAFTTANGSGANITVYSVAVQTDGKVLLGGLFTAWNGATVPGIVRLEDIP
ncbi:MAG: hypothetical protein NTU77_10405, partial [Actinobacteria bacterium]|nr:hypothetical protein [Actinomycetota bacterium]